MKKNKGLLITCVVLLSILVVALVGILVYLLSGSSMHIFTSHSETVVLDQDYHTAEDIVIRSACGDIRFDKSEKANRIHVTAYGESPQDLTVSDTGDTLTINYPAKQRFFYFGTVQNDILITLPAEYAGTIRIESDYGNIQVCDLPQADVTCESDYGNVVLGELNSAKLNVDYGDVQVASVGDLDAELDLGALSVDQITRRCTIQNDCGAVTIDDLPITENSRISDNLGKITVRHLQGVRVDAHTDLGKVSISGDDPDAKVVLTVENDCGDIIIGE